MDRDDKEIGEDGIAEIRRASVLTAAIDKGIRKGWLARNNGLVSATPEGSALADRVMGRPVANPATVLMTGLTSRDGGVRVIQSGNVPDGLMRKMLIDSISA